MAKVTIVSNVDETTPLLPPPAPSDDEATWTPPEKFWLIETGEMHPPQSLNGSEIDKQIFKLFGQMPSSLASMAP
jgi:hypothetical protein